MEFFPGHQRRMRWGYGTGIEPGPSAARTLCGLFMEGQMTQPQVSQASKAPETVSAGVSKVQITFLGGTRSVDLPGKGANVLDLTDEGKISFCDLNAKEQVARKMKIEETRASGIQIAQTIFWSEVSRKFGAVIRCVGCGVPCRKWTSDLHQSHTCLVCGIKAKRAKVSLKRAEKRAESRSDS